MELALIVGVFGVRGELRLHVHNRQGSFLLDGPSTVVLVGRDGARHEARLTCRPGAGKRVLGRIDGLDDRDRAASMKGTRILVSRADFPEPEDGAFYVADLVGIEVRAGERRLGRVHQVHATDGGDVLEIHGAGEPWFLPFASDAISDVDPEAGSLQVDPVLAAEGT